MTRFKLFQQSEKLGEKTAIIFRSFSILHSRRPSVRCVWLSNFTCRVFIVHYRWPQVFAARPITRLCLFTIPLKLSRLVSCSDLWECNGTDTIPVPGLSLKRPGTSTFTLMELWAIIRKISAILLDRLCGQREMSWGPLYISAIQRNHQTWMWQHLGYSSIQLNFQWM